MALSPSTPPTMSGHRLGRVAQHVIAAATAPSPASVDAPHEHASDDSSWDDYVAAALVRAASLGNRGPLARDAAGHPTEQALQHMVEGYKQHGFCVVENVVDPSECASIEAEFDSLLATQPAKNHGPMHEGPVLDRQGNPSRFGGYMNVSKRGVVGIINHPLMMMDSALACYGHPDIMRSVAAINGDDFIAMNEGCFHKAAHEGVPTGWHQDGRTHWDESGAALAQGLTGAEGALTHGLNLSVCITPATPESGLWVVPGSQHQWRLAPWAGRARAEDGSALTEGAFPPISERLPDAVPVVMKPGDIMIVDRSSLHGSYPNRSDQRRVTLIMSFHPRASAVGVKTQNVHAFKNGGAKYIEYTKEDIETRSRMIPLGIDARRQQFPDEEEPYEYRGKWRGDAVWSEKTRAEILEEGNEYWRRNVTL